jgi:hypothetical protein
VNITKRTLDKLLPSRLKYGGIFFDPYEIAIRESPKMSSIKEILFTLDFLV